MNYLLIADIEILMFFNQMAGVSARLDAVGNFLRDSHIPKGMPVVVFWWVIWLRNKESSEQVRLQLLSVVFVSIAAIFIGRILSIILPFRYRPIHDPELNVVAPIGMSPRFLDDWSSMPSDHAVMFFSIAMGFFLYSRTAGIIAFLHASFIVGFLRVWSGIHYPSDIVVGALVGFIVTALLTRPVSTLLQKVRALEFEESRRLLFNLIILHITLQIATMYESARFVLKYALLVFTAWLG